MIKKIAAALLAAMICIFAVGCGANDEAPDGMHLVSVEGEPFKLYVPDAWTNNTSSGISSAYLSATDNILVSARYYTPSDEQMTLDAYAQTLLEGYTESMAIELESNSPSVLGGNDALELIYSAKYDSVEYTFRQLVTRFGGDFVVLTFTCPTDLYESNSTQFDTIVEEFVLCEKIVDEGDCVTDKKTPDGMKIASADQIEYRLYVPQTWICYSESGKSEAYYPESGRPNITVTSYSLDDSEMTVAEYFEMCEKSYSETLSGYELIGSEERTVAERDAISYTYRATYGDMSFTIMQTVLSYNGMIYSITYTALEDSFESHMEDVNAILDAFIFR